MQLPELFNFSPNGVLGLTLTLALVKVLWLSVFLSADNALVIEVAALRRSLQRRGRLRARLRAVGIRALLFAVALALLNLPGLRLIGGLYLLLIAFNMATSRAGDSTQTHSLKNLAAADWLLGLDQALGIAEAVHHVPPTAKLVLVALSFIVCVLMLLASAQWSLRLMERAPWIFTAGCGLLAFLGAEMIWSDTLWAEQFAHLGAAAFLACMAIGCLAVGVSLSKANRR